MSDINRSRVKNSFSRQAEIYDSQSRVQKRVLNHFMDICLRETRKPDSILDVGSGTGRLLDALNCKYPAAQIAGLDLAPGMAKKALQQLSGCKNLVLVCGDGEALPFINDTFSLVVSTSTYQWLYPFQAAFKEVWRVLEPGGGFSFALFGKETLYELKCSYKKALASLDADIQDRTHYFANEEEVLTSLIDAGFRDCSVTSQLEMELHSSVQELMRSLKSIGAGNASITPGRGLSGRMILNRMIDNYQADFGANNSIPATYQVLYCKGRKPKVGRPEGQRVRGSEDRRVRGSEGRKVGGSEGRRVGRSEGRKVGGSEGWKIRGFSSHQTFRPSDPPAFVMLHSLLNSV